MSLFFITDARFLQTPDGKIYSGEFSFSNILWERYIKCFSKVYVIGRVFKVDSFDNENHLVSNVTILPTTPFETATSFLKNKVKIKTQVDNYFNNYEPQAVILRGAGSLGYLAAKYCTTKNISYGIEVVGDPYDVFAPGVIKHPLRFLFRRLFTYYQKEAVKNASSVIYVTKDKLQQRYPSNKNAFQTYASDVVINDIVQKAKVLVTKDVYRIISVGSLDQMYKGPDVLLKAIKILIDNNVKVTLTWLGHGQYLEEIIRLSADLKISEYVDFKGSVDAVTLTKNLDESDVFVLASRTEGLPRAIVEAMARALPCIGSDVGGIPELVNNELVVISENSSQIAERIELLLKNENFYNKMSSYSLEKSSEFRQDILEERRLSFFKSLQKQA
ncbi:glycosyltransferase family 4 protein [Empedobacter falsenii]|uniref:glycosyltransferase n=1 Tax=Empedobacter falsenii TaxID=343874 RepID=UPI0025763CC0|nr:glycosyltransferase [Empedobacter falsenii]MDM1298604.1 glycosyltransferase family 4 protein [Empedobacter falsenii]MDM1318397.1 glycosyltransferase family 4 protein [Empedobacter falsenii]